MHVSWDEKEVFVWAAQSSSPRGMYCIQELLLKNKAIPGCSASNVMNRGPGS